MPDDDLIPLRVADVRVAVPAGVGVEAGLVVLEEEQEPFRQLRMYVGQPEARAIHVAWSNTVPLRPSTWDLFVTTVSLLDARVARVVLTDVEEERHFFAQLELQRDGQADRLVMTARPSDAVALALRAYQGEILARPSVLDDAGVLADGTRWVPPPAVVGSGSGASRPEDADAPIRVGTEVRASDPAPLASDPAVPGPGATGLQPDPAAPDPGPRTSTVPSPAGAAVGEGGAPDALPVVAAVAGGPPPTPPPHQTTDVASPIGGAVGGSDADGGDEAAEFVPIVDAGDAWSVDRAATSSRKGRDGGKKKGKGGKGKKS